MIIAYHVIFTTYGTWLPNDPRGSFSKDMYNEELGSLSGIHYGRRNPQPSKAALRRFWTAAAPRLSRRPYFIDGATRPNIAKGFAEVVNRLDLAVRACAIMNDHVHLLAMRSGHRIEYLAGQFKGGATRVLGLRRTPWARGCWKVFIDNEEVLRCAACYIERNPITAGIVLQHWDFVTPLDE